FGQVLSRYAGRIAGFTEEALQAGRRDDPKQQQFLIGILEAVPGVLRDKDRSALLDGMTRIIQYESAAAFQDVEGFVHLKVPMDRNAGTDRYLLRPECEIVRALGGAHIDENVTGIGKVNGMFRSGGARARRPAWLRPPPRARLASRCPDPLGRPKRTDAPASERSWQSPLVCVV